jgi:hypothetical protein
VRGAWKWWWWELTLARTRGAVRRRRGQGCLLIDDDHEGGMFQIGIIGRGIQGCVSGVYLRERDPEVVVRSRVEAPNPGTVN